MTDYVGACWQKSSYSMGSGDCVELAQLATGEVAVRDSKDQAGPILLFSTSEWTAFVNGVRNCEFDFH